ncbi:MAG: YetF domain-containing protein [Chthoniobacter sp.]
MSHVLKTLYGLFGVEVEAQHLTIAQVLLRAIVVFFATLLIVRVADKRFFAKKTAFDLILGFILASMMARAINGSEQMLPTIAAGFLLALLHRLLGLLACRSKRFGAFIKGSAQTLIESGTVNAAEMKRHHIAEDDLVEELRLKGIESPADARLAVLERSGEISVVRK